MSGSPAPVIPFRLRAAKASLRPQHRLTLDDVTNGDVSALCRLENRADRKKASQLMTRVKNEFRQRLRGQAGTKVLFYRLFYACRMAEQVSCDAAFELGRQFADSANHLHRGGVHDKLDELAKVCPGAVDEIAGVIDALLKGTRR
jgi:hypothetical protein